MRIKCTLFVRTWVSLTKWCFVSSLLANGPVVLVKKILTLSIWKYFCYFVFISPWKRAWPFIWTSLNSLYPRMLHDKFGWNLAQWFWRRWICEKFKDRQRYDGQQPINKSSLWAFRSGELKISENLVSFNNWSNFFFFFKNFYNCSCIYIKLYTYKRMRQ